MPLVTDRLAEYRTISKILSHKINVCYANVGSKYLFNRIREQVFEDKRYKTERSVESER